MERTNYMQSVMMETYEGVAIEAIHRGFAGSWERLIAKRLEQDKEKDLSEAVLILEANGNDPMNAAKMIVESKIPERIKL